MTNMVDTQNLAPALKTKDSSEALWWPSSEHPAFRHVLLLLPRYCMKQSLEDNGNEIIHIFREHVSY